MLPAARFFRATSTASHGGAIKVVTSTTSAIALEPERLGSEEQCNEDSKQVGERMLGHRAGVGVNRGLGEKRTAFIYWAQS